MDWSQWRRHFPVCQRWVFLDHAAVAPLPDRCASRVCEQAISLSQNGIAAYQEWHQHVENARTACAQLLNAHRHDIAFVGSTTAGINAIAEGFSWRAGDNVVLPAEEYPSNQYPWLNLAPLGVECRRVPSRGPRVTIADLLNAIDSKTRVLTISAIEFASGYRNDVILLGEECRKRGIFFFVDAIQALGAFQWDVQNLPVDALAADGHKWLLGPEGAGILWVRPEVLNQLRPIGVGWNSVRHASDFSTIDPTWKADARRYEGGTLNVAGTAGLGESVRLLLEAGMPQIEKRILELTDYLCEQAPRFGLSVFSSRQPEEKSGIVSLLTPDRDPKELMQRCRQGGVIVNVRAGRLRISPHAYNSFDDLDQFLSLLGPST